MDKYYKWDGTTQGVEGLELFLEQKVHFDPDTNCVAFNYNGRSFLLSAEETIAILSEGDAVFIGVDVNVDAAIAQYRASRDTKVAEAPLNPDAPPPVEEPHCNVAPPAYEEGTFEWALTQLGRGNAIRCTAWKPGRVITQDEAANGTWELA